MGLHYIIFFTKEDARQRDKTKGAAPAIFWGSLLTMVEQLHSIPHTKTAFYGKLHYRFGDMLTLIPSEFSPKTAVWFYMG